jgi:adenine-specific DNA methylase
LLCINILADEIKKISNFDLKRLFACLLSGVLEFNNMFCSFKGEGTGAVRHMFSHHILKPELMPIEANIWGTPKSSGSFTTLYNSRIRRALAYKLNPFELELFGKKTSKVSFINKTLNCDIAESFSAFKANGASVYISQGDSAKTDIENNSIDIVVTDPPFFDNVHYSELADFFFYWLNQILDISKKDSTRNIAEVQDTDADKFSGKLSDVFLECNRVLKKNGLLIFTYHHSRHEGWVSVYNAIRKAGFLCIQSFPVKAEMSVSMPIQQAKTPIHLDLILVCKKECDVKRMRENKNIVHTSAEAAKSQMADLIKSGIKVSAGDSKVAFMGRFLCELSRTGNIKKELDLLSNIEKESNEFISELLRIQTTPENKYEIHKEPVQLTLFETMEEYLANKAFKTDKSSDKPQPCHLSKSLE